MAVRYTPVGVISAALMATMHLGVAAGCPSLETPEKAEAYRKTQDGSPRSFAACISDQIAYFPTSGDELDKWLPFYRRSFALLRQLYEQEAQGTSARASYSFDELGLRSTYRLAAASRISSPAGLSENALKELKKQYAIGVDSEYDLILRRTAEGLTTMEQAHQLLIELDPMYLLDQTGARWADVVRTCPTWKPASGVTPTATWCQAICQAEFRKMDLKLSEWLKGKSELAVGSTAAMLETRKAEVAKYCKG